MKNMIDIELNCQLFNFHIDIEKDNEINTRKL